jgi:leucyl aminopeptidase
MNTTLLTSLPATFRTPLLTVFAIENDPPTLLTSDAAVASAAASYLGNGEFKATANETLLLHAPAGLAAERLLVVGLGKPKELDTQAFRKGAGVAVRFVKPRGIRDLSIMLPEASLDETTDSAIDADLAARAIAEGAILAEFDIDIYRSDRKDRTVHSVTVLASQSNERQAAAFREGVIVAEAQNFARSLVNEPGNILTPTELGRRTAAMCSANNLSCEVFGIDKILELKMGAFAAVTQGSSQPPALIVMRYEPATTPAEGAPVLALVGKGITFDTGGISIKPAENMDKMKYDMAGAAAMIGAMQAIAQLKPNVRVLSIVCSCENMPDALAFKPGDVITAMSGKTIEIMNTDAEGRLVLADGLHYAKTLGATHLINAATLTGAIGVALGLHNAGLFSNDDEATQQLLTAASVTGEKFWRMPCTDDYREQIKSQIADIMNTGGSRYGGAISAAMFLKEFVGDTPWIHLDIATLAWIDDNKPWQSRGPSGIGVRSITEWVSRYAS